MTAAEVLDWLDGRTGHMIMKVPRKDTFEQSQSMWVDLGPTDDAVRAVLMAAVNEGQAVTYKDKEEDDDGQD